MELSEATKGFKAVIDLTKLKSGGILVLSTVKGLEEVDIEANPSKLAVTLLKSSVERVK